MKKTLWGWDTKSWSELRKRSLHAPSISLHIYEDNIQGQKVTIRRFHSPRPDAKRRLFNLR